MKLNDPFRGMTRAPDDPGGNPPADPPADPPAGDPGAPPPAEPPAGKWWEGSGLTDEQRTQITALGLTVEDPVQAVAKLADMERAAKQKLGKPAGSLIEKPGEGKDVAEWLREHGDMLGIPKEAAGYEVAPPEGWPKDAEWNKDLEGKARELAHRHGLSGAALNDFVGLYAGEIGRLASDAADQLAAANTEMQAALRKDWGDQYEARVAQARQASGVVAEAAGLGAEQIAAIAALMKPKIGDAGTVKLFAAIGELMGEERMVGGGGGNLGTTPAEARQRLSELRAPDGAYAKAVAAAANGDKAELKRLQPEIDRLTKIVAGG